MPEARQLPLPADLRRLGVRPVLTSYAWGVLKAVVVDRIGLRVVRPINLRDFAGVWRITTTAEMDREYWEAGESEPTLTLSARPSRTGLAGEYEIGLSSGSIVGDRRDFGGEPIVVFGYAGMDEVTTLPAQSG